MVCKLLIECKELIKIYYDPKSNLKVPALRGVDLDVEEGDLIALIGPSGSGKSTFINLLAGHDTPSSGEIRFREKLINKYSGREMNAYRRNHVGFLYQMPEKNLLWNLSVQQNILLPMKLSDKWGFHEQKRRVKELLSNLEITHRKDHKPHQLSGGEAQRVGLAVALANDPEIILADEPTGELDSVTTMRIIDFLKKLNSDYGKTVIVVTHDPQFARMTSKTYKIQDGRFMGYFENKEESEYSESEQYSYVDKYGTLTIPENYRKTVGIKNYVKFKIVNGELLLTPVKKDKE
ncbi:MAG: ABC transporter ATP-binding protein [Candidatus Hodarchaeales archaeon]